MVFMRFKNTLLLSLFLVVSCGKRLNTTEKTKEEHNTMLVEQPTVEQPSVSVAANNTAAYLPILNNKNVGIVANQTSVIMTSDGQYTHLVDSLLTLQVNVKKVFAPEHGFRGTADAGERIKDGTDPKTGLPIISLYGKNKKPTPTQLENIDIVIFDIQDVGARFYTYISTLHYVMEACAAAEVPVIVLDRPNPNGHYIDGPVLHPEHKSFIGMHPVPIVHGMTIGEYAQMINGERWLANGKSCNLTVIPIKNYTHQTSYSLPIKPSPNLPNDKAINLYPSLCLFEGTNVSVGRGTSHQFQRYGSPFLPKSEFQFTPEPNEGAKKPLHKGKICYGEDLSTIENLQQLQLNWLIKAYQNTPDKNKFFRTSFARLSGTSTLQQQIEAGLSAEAIRKSWLSDLEAFKIIRKKYLIYDDTL
ncbi:MAG: DUF1343 domain-containing protein [Bacteroidota bacterium]